MDILRIDIETYSSIDLPKHGVYRYASADDFKVQLTSFALNDEPVRLLDFELMDYATYDSSEFIRMLKCKDIRKAAFNAEFEITCLSRMMGYELPIREWQCTMAKALYYGYPASLAGAGKVAGVSEESQKLKDGKMLVQYFSKPCKPSKTNPKGYRSPQDAPERWERYREYNKQDVEAERALDLAMSRKPLPKMEQELWEHTVEMSRSGVIIDMKLVKQALKADKKLKEDAEKELRELTGLEKVTNPTLLCGWINANGFKIDSLAKAKLEEVDTSKATPNVQRALELRKVLSRTSLAKYATMQNMCGKDNVLHGLLQYYGASATGRWAGRGVQVHNLPRSYVEPIEHFREAFAHDSVEDLKDIFDSESISNIYAQLIRTAIIPTEGCVFAVADYSAIEARVISWFANETWRLEVFKTHGKIYEASASKMFKVPIESIAPGKENYALRAKGKVSELALGFQGGTAALVRMGALKGGIKEEELQGLVDGWRQANPNIKKMWYDIQNTVIRVIKTGKPMISHKCKFSLRDKKLVIELPSGRELFYHNIRLGLNKWDGESIVFDGINQVTKQWGQQETYGGKLTENIVQAVARDCLADVVLKMDERGAHIKFHVHDEIIIQCRRENAEDVLNKMLKMMAVPPQWAPDLPVGAEGFISDFYKKG